MFQKLKAAWQAGIAGQPMPASVDKSTGQTAAIVGITGIAVLVVFGTAYGFGRVERAARLAEDKERKALENEEADIATLGRDMRKETITAEHIEEEEEGEEEVDYEETAFRQDPETGEIIDPADADPEPEGAEDLWDKHVSSPSE